MAHMWHHDIITHMGPCEKNTLASCKEHMHSSPAAGGFLCLAAKSACMAQQVSHACALLSQMGTHALLSWLEAFSGWHKKVLVVRGSARWVGVLEPTSTYAPMERDTSCYIDSIWH